MNEIGAPGVNGAPAIAVAARDALAAVDSADRAVRILAVFVVPARLRRAAVAVAR